MSEMELFELVVGQVRETALLEATMALLQWDERTGLPSMAGSYRAEQVRIADGRCAGRMEPAL